MKKESENHNVTLYMCFVYELHNMADILNVYAHYHISFPRFEMSTTRFNKLTQGKEQLEESDPSDMVLTSIYYLVFSKSVKI